MNEPLFRVSNVSKSFGLTEAVCNITFELYPGDRVALQGPSGSGKTTLLRLLAGLERPDSGAIELDGVTVSTLNRVTPPHRRGIGFVFQTPALWPHLTVAQNILFGLGRLSRRDGSRRLHELLELTGLSGLERRFPEQLSGGEARRAALARSLAPSPRCLLMDEPLTNLDPELKEQMINLILKTAKPPTVLFYVTHDREEAAQLGRRLLFIKNGFLQELPPGEGREVGEMKHHGDPAAGDSQ